MKKLSAVWLVLIGAMALLAPLLANDAPLVARARGELRFPAFASFFGRADVGPDRQSAVTWREWWAALPLAGGDEWAVFAPCPYGPLGEADAARANAGPTPDHVLGTDALGRDLLARLIWGTRTALLVGAGAVALALLIGVPLGALAGYRGGLADALISLCIEVFLCFPALFLALAAAAFAGSSALAVIIVLGVVYWTAVARIVRGELLSLREREFVLAARGLGVRTPRLLLRHVLPSVRGPVAVTAAFLFAGAIVVEATLSFLGLGPGGDSDSWGTILAQSKEPALRGVWHLWLFPALVLIATVWSLHVLADRARRELRAERGAR